MSENNKMDTINNEIEIDYEVIDSTSRASNGKKNYNITQDKMMDALEWAYTTTVNGIPGQKSVQDLAHEYLEKYESVDSAIDRLIKVQTTKAATSGFLAGLGGVIILPISIPANISTVILFQMRMIGAIAVMRGYDLQSDEVQTLVYLSLAGLALNDIVKVAGISFGNKMSITLIKKIPTEVLKKINQKVGFRFVTKFGEKGIVNIAKLIPVVGGIVGGGFDTVYTLAVGKNAKKNFTDYQ